MSTNIYFYGTREVKVIKTGKIENQVVEIPIWQTPTQVTHAIEHSRDPIKTYTEWVLAQCQDAFIEKEHVEHILRTIDILKEKGYDIIYESC